jgi:phosphoglycerol transferase MdoB-like AlkP superfamily enzyme
MSKRCPDCDWPYLTTDELMSHLFSARCAINQKYIKQEETVSSTNKHYNFEMLGNESDDYKRGFKDAIEQREKAEKLKEKAHQTLDAYLNAGGPYEFVIVSEKDIKRNT